MRSRGDFYFSIYIYCDENEKNYHALNVVPLFKQHPNTHRIIRELFRSEQNVPGSLSLSLCRFAALKRGRLYTLSVLRGARSRT